MNSQTQSLDITCAKVLFIFNLFI